MSARLTFKIADCEAEFEAVHALNHRIFTGEIPQHTPRPDGRLVDRFHDENTYLIACAGTHVVGMLALRARRPFSLDSKLPDLDAHLPSGRNWAEVRLLAVEREWRGTRVFAGLLKLLETEFIRRGLDAAVVSATTRQLRLYRHLGFDPFGPLVGSTEARYQPMHLLIERFRENFVPGPARGKVNLLPGPVTMSREVREACMKPPLPHRSAAFVKMVAECRERLRALTGANGVALIPGGGTMANEVVCAQLSAMNEAGVVLSLGEFGERLADHASRAQLQFKHLCGGWGAPLDLEKVRAWLDANPETRWLWTVHCETSTGALMPLEDLADLCEARGIRLCLDCVSSLGVVPVDLRRVALASSSSGKGLAALAGAGIVFHNQPPHDSENIPRALDLALYASNDGVPFTLASNVLGALHASLQGTDWTAKHGLVHELGTWLRNDLSTHGMRVVDSGSTAVITVALPGHLDAVIVATKLEQHGWLAAVHSPHLRARNWLQLCLMGGADRRALEGLAPALAEITSACHQRR